MSTKLNEELNAMPHNQGKICRECLRSYPETILNIEGVIHHGCQYKCLDTKSCQRAKKKLKKKK